MDDVVEQWLRAELASSRFGGRLEQLMARDGLDETTIGDPAYRLRLLAEFRGQVIPDGSGPVYVDGVPISEVRWDWAAVSRAELAEVLYIDWDYWLEVTAGTRRPIDFVRRLRAEPADPLPILEEIAAEYRAGHPLPPMILVDAGPGTRVVALEGHFRLTALILAGPDAPDELEVLFGRSPLIADWTDY